jgi:tetratricopeptide (TPR) repeat protein
MLGLCEFQTREYDEQLVSLLRGRSLGLAAIRSWSPSCVITPRLLYIHFEQFEIALTFWVSSCRAGNDSPKVVRLWADHLADALPRHRNPAKRDLILLAGRAQSAWPPAAEVRAGRFRSIAGALSQCAERSLCYGVFLLNQDSDAALKEFKREMEISPQHQPSMVQMAFEYLKRDDYNAALPLAEKAVQLNPKMFPRATSGSRLTAAGPGRSGDQRT